jgi:hypothetical protein
MTGLVEVTQVVIDRRRTIEEEVHPPRRGGVGVCIAELGGLHVDVDVDGRGEGKWQRSLVKRVSGQTSRRAAEGV